MTSCVLVVAIHHERMERIYRCSRLSCHHPIFIMPQHHSLGALGQVLKECRGIYAATSQRCSIPSLHCNNVATKPSHDRRLDKKVRTSPTIPPSLPSPRSRPSGKEDLEIRQIARSKKEREKKKTPRFHQTQLKLTAPWSELHPMYAHSGALANVTSAGRCSVFQSGDQRYSQ